MSDFFVSKLNAETKCPGCKKGKLVVGRRVYSLCAGHLQYARDQWRKWSSKRQAQGRCISCDRRGWKGGNRRNARGHRINSLGERLLRCKDHTLENRAKCANWMAEQLKLNPNYHTERHLVRQSLYTENGKCPSCRQHRPLPPGFRRCDECRERQRTARTA